MTARDWKPGDKALVEVEVEIADPLAARVTIADDPGYWIATEALRPVPAAGEAATEAEVEGRGPVSAQEREALVRLVWDDETTCAEAADLADKIIAAGWRLAADVAARLIRQGDDQ